MDEPLNGPEPELSALEKLPLSKDRALKLEAPPAATSAVLVAGIEEAALLVAVAVLLVRLFMFEVRLAVLAGRTDKVDVPVMVLPVPTKLLDNSVAELVGKIEMAELPEAALLAGVSNKDVPVAATSSRKSKLVETLAVCVGGISNADVPLACLPSSSASARANPGV